VFDRSVLCSWECLHVKRGRGKTVKEFQFQFQTVTLLFVLFQFRRDRREGVVLRKLLTCRLEETTPFGDHFPPKSPTRHRFRNLYFPPKAQHGTVLGIYISPQKPTRRRFGDQLSHQIAHVGPAFFLSFLVFGFFLLSYFGLV
jgi:hypothetical protein